jgi:hypothetical protein
MPFGYEQGSIGMNSQAFEAGDQVRIVKNEFGREPGKLSGITGIARPIDKDRQGVAHEQDTSWHSHLEPQTFYCKY